MQPSKKLLKMRILIPVPLICNAMKITISYKPEEAEKAGTLERLVKAAMGKVRIHCPDPKGGYMHTYISNK